MGHRANLIIVEESGYSLYYCHWCSLTIPSNMFWGPAHARAFIQNQELETKGYWLDTVFSEGGVIFDPIQKVLLLWGGEFLRYFVLKRRLYFSLMQYQWQGWELRWAFNEQIDLAKYVGKDPQDVILDHDFPKQDSDMLPELATDLANTDLIISIDSSDEGLSVYPFSSGSHIKELLVRGPAILDEIKRSEGFQKFDFDALGLDMPFVGVHIDEMKREIKFWSAVRVPLPSSLGLFWPGWRIKIMNDDYEQHEELAMGAIVFPKPHAEAILEQVHEMLMPDGPSPLDAIANIMTKFQNESEEKDIQINPHALQYNPLELSEDAKVEIFSNAVHQWRQDRQMP